MSAIGVLIIGLGLLLIWSAIKGQNPLTQLTSVISGGPKS